MQQGPASIQQGVHFAPSQLDPTMRDAIFRLQQPNGIVHGSGAGQPEQGPPVDSINKHLLRPNAASAPPPGSGNIGYNTLGPMLRRVLGLDRPAPQVIGQ